MSQFEAKLIGADKVRQIIGGIAKKVHKAQRTGFRKAASEVRKAFRANVSFKGERAPEGKLGMRTGEYRKNIKQKLFQFRDGSWGASIRVKGKRNFVFRLHETGYVGRGGVTVQARQPGQKALEQHKAQIPALIERFVDEELRKI